MPQLDTTSRTHVLFLDMEEVSERRNVELAVVEAKKHELNPILPLGDINEWDSTRASPWESRTVIYDAQEECFKTWYGGMDLVAETEWTMGYATSPDGVRWCKPKLGLYEYRESKQNNICNTAWGPVIKDEAEPDSDRRYKAILKGPPRELGTRLAYSPDGVRWSNGPNIELPEWGGLNWDVVIFLRDDKDPDPARRFKIVWQTMEPANKPGPPLVRAKNLGWSPDAENWMACPSNPILHPNDSTEQEDHFLMIIPYHDWYVMLYEYGWYLPNGAGAGHGIAECWSSPTRQSSKTIRFTFTTAAMTGNGLLGRRRIFLR